MSTIHPKVKASGLAAVAATALLTFVASVFPHLLTHVTGTEVTFVAAALTSLAAFAAAYLKKVDSPLASLAGELVSQPLNQGWKTETTVTTHSPENDAVLTKTVTKEVSAPVPAVTASPNGRAWNSPKS